MPPLIPQVFHGLIEFECSNFTKIRIILYLMPGNMIKTIIFLLNLSKVLNVYILLLNNSVNYSNLQPFFILMSLKAWFRERMVWKLIGVPFFSHHGGQRRNSGVFWSQFILFLDLTWINCIKWRKKLLQTHCLVLNCWVVSQGFRDKTLNDNNIPYKY